MKFIDDIKKEIIRTSFKTVIIELGVISGKSKFKRTASIGITNAELMYIHEHGSKDGRIPKRPVLMLALQDAMTMYIPAFFSSINNIFDKVHVEHQLDVLCNKIENHAKNMIYHGDKRLTPLKQSTINRKKSDLPLFDTGQLARSIKCRWRYID